MAVSVRPWLAVGGSSAKMQVPEHSVLLPETVLDVVGDSDDARIPSPSGVTMLQIQRCCRSPDGRVA